MLFTPPAITSVVNLNSTPVEIDASGMVAGTYTVLDVDQLKRCLGGGDSHRRCRHHYPGWQQAGDHRLKSANTVSNNEIS